MIFKVHYRYFVNETITSTDGVEADDLKYEEGMVTFYKKSGVKVKSNGNKEIDYNFVVAYPIDKVIKIEAMG